MISASGNLFWKIWVIIYGSLSVFGIYYFYQNGVDFRVLIIAIPWTLLGTLVLVILCKCGPNTMAPSDEDSNTNVCFVASAGD